MATRIANILARLTRFIPEPAAPVPRVTKSFRGLKVGDRLTPLDVGGAEGIAVAPPDVLLAVGYGGVLVVKHVNSLGASIALGGDDAIVLDTLNADWKTKYKKLPKPRKSRAKAKS